MSGAKSNIIKIYSYMQNYRWFCVLDIIFTQLLSVIRNPNYVFFSVIALTLGTMGVWIDAFPYGLKGLIGFGENVSRITAFTFCIATLGNFATESYFDTKNVVKPNNELKRNLGIFSWSICLFLTFYSYIGSESSMLGFWATIAFWLFVNVDKPEFRKTTREVINNMSPKEGVSEEIKGAGL